MTMVGLVLWGMVWAGFAEAGTAKVVEVNKSEVVLSAGRRDGLALDAEVSLLRSGSPIVHPLTGQVLGQPQEPVGMARVFEVGAHQSRAVVEKAYTAVQVGDVGEFESGAAQVPESAAGHGHQQAAPPHQHEAAGGQGGHVAAPVREGHGQAASGQGGHAAAPVREGHGQAASGEGQMQQRLKELERSVEEYHSSSKTLKAYPVFAQRVWDEISTMKSYLVSLDERLAQIEEQNQERHHLGPALGGDSPGEEGMREFTIRYAHDTQVKVQVAGKTLLISVVHDSLHVEEEGAAPLVAAVGGEVQEHGDGQVQVVEPAHRGEEGPAGEEAHGEEGHGAGADHEGQVPWYQSPWVLGIGVLTLGLVAGVISWMIKRRYEEESEGLEADYLEEEEEEEEEEEDEDEDEDDGRPSGRRG